MSTAENSLVWDLLGPEMSRARQVPAWTAGYGDVRGNPDLRAAVAEFASSTFLGRPVAADDVCTMAGAGAILEAVFWSLCDPGDGVLVATPGYAGFWMDLENRDEAVIVPVPTDPADGFRITTEALERAWNGAERPIKALLLCSPDNPTGRVLSENELRAVVEWPRNKRIHLVSDEIYALSVHGDATFVSVSGVADLEEDIHIIWAISKDLAANGLRCGFLFSHNERLKSAVSGQAIWAAVSGRTQHFVSELLADRGWTDKYLVEMPRRLAEAHHVLSSGFSDAGIRHFPAQAGFFLIADLRLHLDEPTFDSERDLWRRMVDQGVNLTPGKALRSPDPGLFRVCFSATPTESLPLAVDRIRTALA
ncbi:MAG: aminotransferase class I/II-fold pyridoxal phosphate-dependent enzyme [Acidimicrobiia bacterium]|nr:aminotransferase class I/II-fold pyridoxal phosphate-dependent enzyme [Acidimicrobiia bacterium]